ncbi:ZZ-type zinc finger-containing protein 3 [Sitophilus oryzae]|uniref:ZZ-type zinc finger-containing protein 3 n=1 Tax=Sitophilus oryzae TaxID=7048 RepID=A0A6J2YT79_SITOR|nr:ZZ-type zinc finger-containing protein 3 [Sitophilus oryzae]
MDEMVPVFDTENDLFSFESDHLALRGNKDYCDVLKTLVILTAQREQALKDFKVVSDAKNEALKNPIAAVEKLKKEGNLGIPPLLVLPKLPKIDFQKFTVKVPESEILDIYSSSAQVADKKLELKSNNNSRAWSLEEQKRLEELLQIYPPEPIEMRRYQKIAKALGNRTVQQVSSRLQKYFLKLYRAGLPVPGRIPKSCEKHKKSNLHKHQRHNHYLWKPTTFFPELNVPVQMENMDNIPGPSNMSPHTEYPNQATSENYLMRTDYHHNDENESVGENCQELQINLLKRVRQEKSKEDSADYMPFSHAGYKCDYCEEDPIIGSRWHCIVCPDSVDYCTDCVLSQLYSENPHPLSHWLAIYTDDSENYSLPENFSESNNSENKTEGFDMTSDDDDTSS